MDIEKVRRIQAAMRAEAMKGTIEEAVSALTAVLSEVVLSVEQGGRQNLMHVAGKMLVDYVKQGEKSQVAQPTSILRPN